MDTIIEFWRSLNLELRLLLIIPTIGAFVAIYLLASYWSEKKDSK